MANPHHLTPTLLLFFAFTFIITQFSSLISARVLPDDFLPQSLAATQPAFNLVLPSQKVIQNDVVSSKKESKEHGLPCDMEMELNKKSSSGDRGIPAANSPKLAGKYGPMLLNMLPKGPVTPSGPSKGTNNIND